MENSVSAPQYPQERAEQIKTKLHEKANKPLLNRRCLCRKAARVFGVKATDLPAVRLAMMAVGPAGWRNTESELVAEKKLQGKLLLQLCSVEDVSSFSPVRVFKRISGRANHRTSSKSLQRRKQIHA